MRKAEAAKSFRQSRPELWLALTLSSPPYHTHKPHRKIVFLPSYLCLLAILLFVPSPCLSPFLTAVTAFRLLFPGPLRSSGNLQWKHQGGGLGGEVLFGCVDTVRTNSPFYLVYRQFEQCCYSPSLANIRTDGFNFSPLPSSLGISPPATNIPHIPQPLCLQTSCGRFGLS